MGVNLKGKSTKNNNSTTSEHFQKWPKNQGVVLALSLSISLKSIYWKKYQNILCQWAIYMAKMFNIHVDVYLVLKMFDFYFFKSKSRLLLFE